MGTVGTRALQLTIVNPMSRASRRASSRANCDRPVWKRIEAFNRGRRPELVARKYRAMARDPFVFFRGTAHLFWEDWGSMGGTALDDAPLAWCCGVALEKTAFEIATGWIRDLLRSVEN